MTGKKLRRAGAWLAGAGMFFLYFAVLLAVFHNVGTDDALYHKLQMDANILPEAGISEEELISLDADLANYLAGDASALDGSSFNERELKHMADCFDLFVLLRRVLLVAGIAAAALLAGAALLGQRAPDARSALVGALAFLGLIAIVGVWGIVDFDSLFTAFHRLLFTNDLWLLDPRTDLLIRICPQSMFMSMALRIAGEELGFIVLINALARIIPAVFRRTK